MPSAALVCLGAQTLWASQCRPATVVHVCAVAQCVKRLSAGEYGSVGDY